MDFLNHNILLLLLFKLYYSFNEVNGESEWSYSKGNIHFQALKSPEQMKNTTLESICIFNAYHEAIVLLLITETDFKNYLITFSSDQNDIKNSTIGDEHLGKNAKQGNVKIDLIPQSKEFSLLIHVEYKTNTAAKFTLKAIEPQSLFVDNSELEGNCDCDKDEKCRCSNDHDVLCKTNPCLGKAGKFKNGNEFCKTNNFGNCISSGLEFQCDCINKDKWNATLQMCGNKCLPKQELIKGKNGDYSCQQIEICNDDYRNKNNLQQKPCGDAKATCKQSEINPMEYDCLCEQGYNNLGSKNESICQRSNTPGSKLGGGTIAAIVIGSIVVLALIGWATFRFLKNRRPSLPPAHMTSITMTNTQTTST